MSACQREGIGPRTELISGIDWVFPDRPLSVEIMKVLDAGYLKGADLWHVATALYFSSEFGEVGFLTLDIRQRRVAETLGFRVD